MSREVRRKSWGTLPAPLEGCGVPWRPSGVSSESWQWSGRPSRGAISGELVDDSGRSECFSATPEVWSASKKVRKA